MADQTYSYVISEVGKRLGNRTDLDQVARDHIQDRINYYSREVFYSAEFTDTSKVCTIGSPWVDIPAGWDDVARLRLLQSATIWLPMVRVPYEAILEVDVLNPSFRSLPSRYGTYISPVTGNMAVRLFPAPNLAYPLEFTMSKPPAAPVNDTDINFWTQDAQTLTIESACESVARLYLNDPIRAQTHQVAKETEESSLNSRSIRIRGGIKIRAYL